jgi:hypothetical protein
VNDTYFKADDSVLCSLQRFYVRFVIYDSKYKIDPKCDMVFSSKKKPKALPVLISKLTITIECSKALLIYFVLFIT